MPPDHPAFAVVAPPRMARFRALLDLGPDDPITADLTGWSKLVLLTPEAAVLFPRDHTQVEALAREVTALEAVAAAGLPTVPAVRRVIDDRAICAHPVVVVDRLPGVPLSGLVADLEPAALGDLFAAVGRAAARWHDLPTERMGSLPHGDALAGATDLVEALGLDSSEAIASQRALRRAQTLDPVLVHGDLHEGQLLVDPDQPTRLTGIIDWQTARIDHPFADFDLGEWGTSMWRTHRRGFPELRRRAWTAYAAERGLPDDLGPVFEVHHALAHARKLLGRRPFPVQHDPGVVGTLEEARAEVRGALQEMR
jgi:aminoglycoside phosphotransferase (APT) family kinase protein